MLWRDDGTPTFHLASVVDDIDFGITHVIRGSDHRANEELHAALHRALGLEPPEVIHHGLVVGDDGKKLSKRAEGATVASLRDAGYPAEAVRAYLEELDLPKHDVHLDLDAIRSLSIDVLAELVRRGAGRAGRRAGRGGGAAARGARPRRGAGARTAAVLEPPSVDSSQSPETLGAVRRAARAVPGDARQGRGEGDRARAEGGRRQPEGVAGRAHRPRARAGALGRAARAAA